MHRADAIIDVVAHPVIARAGRQRGATARDIAALGLDPATDVGVYRRRDPDRERAPPRQIAQPALSRRVAGVGDPQKLRDAHEQALRQVIAEGIAQGAFRPVDIDTTSRAVLSMLNWMVRWFKPGKGRRAASFAQDYCDLMLGGLRN